jgi:hypothetical protein
MGVCQSAEPSPATVAVGPRHDARCRLRVRDAPSGALDVIIRVLSSGILRIIGGLTISGPSDVQQVLPL